MSIGMLTWDDCETCKNYRPDIGGCKNLDERGPEILGIDVSMGSVICDEYDEKPAKLYPDGFGGMNGGVYVRKL